MSSDTETLTLRSGGDDDIPAVIELMRASLGEGSVPRTQEFWIWKHRANPFGPSPMWLAHSGARLVGVRLFLRWRLNAAGHEYAAVRAVDTATHPDFQGKGIFKRLTQKLVEEELASGTDLIFNTPNDKSRPGYLKMGWSSAGRLSLWFRPSSPRKLILAALQGPASAADDTETLESPASSTDFSAAAAAGLLSKQDGARFHTATTSAYLRWRYSAPGLQYSSVAFDDTALVMFRLRRRGSLRELRLCDIFTRQGIAGALGLRSCLSRLVEAYHPDYVVAAHRPELGASLCLASSGFLPAPRIGPILTVRALGLPASAPDPKQLDNWSTSIGDLELF